MRGLHARQLLKNLQILAGSRRMLRSRSMGGVALTIREAILCTDREAFSA